MSGSEDFVAMAALLPANPRDAVAEAQHWMAVNGPHPEALRIAAAGHRMLGQAKAAQQAEIAAIAQSKSIAALDAASRKIAAREFSAAHDMATRHLSSFPDDLMAMTITAEALLGLGYPDRAVPILEDVLQRAPAYLLARTLLVNALTMLDRLSNARTLLEPVARRLPDVPDVHELLGKITSRQGDFEAAVANFRTVTRLRPDHVEGWTNLAENLRFLGRKDEALATYRKAIAVNPRHGGPWWGIADLSGEALTHEDCQMIEQIIDEAITPIHAANMHFALGIVREREGNHAAAFAHFQSGNDFRRAQEAYDGAALATLLEQHLALLPAIPEACHPPPSSGIPVFIVGMPRAGSTLLERILGQHPAIEALGELPIIPHLAERLQRDGGDDGVASKIARLSKPQLQSLGDFYRARANEMRRMPERTFFIDKMHMNWRHLPLILRILPEAKIIDIRRNAMDCCWSNFRTMFGNGHSAALEQTDIAHFYREYASFVDRLAEQAPANIFQLSYEALVDKPEYVTSQLCDYLGVEPDEAMLAFHLSRQPVATASSEQVRQPLNRRGIGAWLPYAEWLGPMREALGPLATN